MKLNRKPKISEFKEQPRRRVGDFKQTAPLTGQSLEEGKNGPRTPLQTGRVPVMNLPNSGVENADEARLEPPKKRFRFFGRRRLAKAPEPSRRKRIIKRTLKILVALVIIGAIVVGLKTWLAINNIIDRNGDGSPALTGDTTQLRGEGDGRINILLVGIGGKGHEGGDLADTVIVASIDPFAKEMAMLSLPRDLWVTIPGYGANKINAAHAFGEQYGYNGKSKAGIALLTQTVEDTLDIPLHYYVRVDFDGFKQAIDAVGGVDVNVKERIYDTQFAWQYGILDLKPGQHHLDGTKALMYARSRYSSARGDFARADRQREILLLLKEKVLSAGTYKDPRRVTALIETAGGHVRTNLQLNEMMRLYDLVSEIPQNKIISAGLSTDEDNFLVGQNIGGASALVPRTGTFDEIQKYVRKLLVDGFIRSEAAKVDVLNGSGVAGLATEQAELLESFGYKVTKVGNAPANVTETVIYDLSNGAKPATKQYLEKRYGVAMLGADQLPSKVTTTSDFVIIVGSNAAQTTQ